MKPLKLSNPLLSSTKTRKKPAVKDLTASVLEGKVEKDRRTIGPHTLTRPSLISAKTAVKPSVKVRPTTSKASPNGKSIADKLTGTTPKATLTQSRLQSAKVPATDSKVRKTRKDRITLNKNFFETLKNPYKPKPYPALN